MNVPCGVMMGMSPKNSFCSLISPVSFTTSWVVMSSGAEYVVSFSRHSCSVYFGFWNSWFRNRNSNRFPVKSSMGDTSSSRSFRPPAWSQLKESSWMLIRFGTSSTCGMLA